MGYATSTLSVREQSSRFYRPAHFTHSISSQSGNSAPSCLLLSDRCYLLSAQTTPPPTHPSTGETSNIPAPLSSSGATPSEMPTTPARPAPLVPTPVAKYSFPAQTATPSPLHPSASAAPAPDSASAAPRTAPPPES